MWNEATQKGILNDFDFAGLMKPGSTSLEIGFERTGTKAYMALQLLDEGALRWMVPRMYRHARAGIFCMVLSLDLLICSRWSTRHLRHSVTVDLGQLPPGFGEQVWFPGQRKFSVFSYPRLYSSDGVPSILDGILARRLLQD